MFNKMHISALSTLLLISSFTISMEQQSTNSSVNHFAAIPTELKCSILTFLTASDSLEQAIKNIKALATTNKDFNTLFQKPTATQTLIEILSNTFTIRQFDVAVALNTEQALKWIELYLKGQPLENVKQFCMEAVTKKHSSTVAMCLKTGLSIMDLTDAFGTSVLELASGNGAQDVVRFLLPYYQEAHETKDFALQFACDANELETSTVLLDNGASPNNALFNNTPLIVAIQNNNKALVTLLLGYGANKSTKDRSDRSALDYAQKIGNQDIIDLLSE
jgi:Ankyrin repeats (3 copies)